MLSSKSSFQSQRSILLGTVLIERIAPYLALVLTKIEFRRHTRTSKRGPAFSVSYGSHCNRPHCFAGSSHVIGGLHDVGPNFPVLQTGRPSWPYFGYKWVLATLPRPCNFILKWLCLWILWQLELNWVQIQFWVSLRYAVFQNNT